jgi:hypothetical protein
MGAHLRVQVLLRAGHIEQSEAQLREGERAREGSVEHKSRADEQEPHFIPRAGKISSRSVNPGWGGVGWGRLCILLISCTSVVILVIDQDRIAILNPERQAPIAADRYRPAPSKPSRQRMKPPAWQIHVPWRLSPVQLRQLPRQPSRLHHLDAGLCSLLKKASIPLSRGTRSVSKRNKPASSCKPWTPNRTRPSLTWATGRWTRPTPTSTSSTVANSRV